ncbi:hypothetical protein [Mycobacterium lepromatosis]|uniref:hypothetical protein n=1 Tax=Mycobacterium lepromatosis TaxID=480418 RepID=UPI000A977AC4|nr:hypothetical protein [Mycobacterium lepromatosis]
MSSRLAGAAGGLRYLAAVRIPPTWLPGASGQALSKIAQAADRRAGLLSGA